VGQCFAAASPLNDELKLEPPMNNTEQAVALAKQHGAWHNGITETATFTYAQLTAMLTEQDRQSRADERQRLVDANADIVSLLDKYGVACWVDGKADMDHPNTEKRYQKVREAIASLQAKLEQSEQRVRELEKDAQQPDKYDPILLPFVEAMRRELHANSGKGDRSGWLSMTRGDCLLEIYHHLAKLQKAARSDDLGQITEHAADVANMAMMLLDICGGIDALVWDTAMKEKP
jgi:hypothetical protein